MSRPESHPTRLRGYFAIGAERISKPFNLGNLMRSAHAFGASFFFTVDAHHTVSGGAVRRAHSDTSNAPDHMPLFQWSSAEAMRLPHGCQLVGVELLDDAVDLPSFRHPSQAAYVFGAERGSLSSEVLERCDHVVKIPTAFCINIAMAGAIVMYDRVRSLGRFPAPPVMPGGDVEPIEVHVHGEAFSRSGDA